MYIVALKITLNSKAYLIFHTNNGVIWYKMSAVKCFNDTGMTCFQQEEEWLQGKGLLHHITRAPTV